MKQHIYFLGIGGTLMGSLAQLAKSQGYRVSGSDNQIYPPMSDLLADAKIEVFDHFDPAQLAPTPDQIVIGNANQARGNQAIEYILDQGFDYVSGAEWLGSQILRDKWVIAVSGTHGKTTTASMLAWILEKAGLEPGFLIGGSPANFNCSARLGKSPFFVVEADEYDTSFFDRRSKFVHYRPKTLVINNLEYDHADIFPSIKEIQNQFHLLIRSIPSDGLIIAPADDQNIQETLDMGCWTPHQTIQTMSGETESEQVTKSCDWASHGEATNFQVFEKGKLAGQVRWSLLGEHNRCNGLSAIAAASHVGVSVDKACEALSSFKGVKRRLETIYRSDTITVYDDFAHHPSAIKKTLEGIRKQYPHELILAVIEPRTHTMSLGALQADLVSCNKDADQTFWFKGQNIKWDLEKVAELSSAPSRIFNDLEMLINELESFSNKKSHTHIVLMSNGAFGGIHRKLVGRLSQQ